MRRGRPKYDDVLTPREWEVLELVRQGKTNEQIALELGISVNGAKFHVSEIISKLGVSSRREAAAQRLEPRLQRTASRVFLPLGLLRFAGVAVLALAAVGLVALAAGVLISRDSSDSNTVASPPSPTPVPEGATPTPTLTVDEASADATASAAASRPTPSPTPVLAPSGEPVPVWVYADTEPANDCLDLLQDMIPASAPDSISGKPVECTLPDDHRLRLVQHDDGFFHFESIMMRVLLRSELPARSDPGLHACEDVRELVLLASEPPKAETFIGDCAYVPPYRGEPERTGSLIWTNVENALAPAEIVPDVPCEVPMRYLSSDADIGPDLRDETCVLR
jgi:DNA-binding CsgD family transcriptional regulator